MYRLQFQIKTGSENLVAFQLNFTVSVSLCLFAHIWRVYVSEVAAVLLSQLHFSMFPITLPYIWLWFETAIYFLDCIGLVEKTALDKSFD